MLLIGCNRLVALAAHRAELGFPPAPTASLCPSHAPPLQSSSQPGECFPIRRARTARDRREYQRGSLPAVARHDPCCPENRVSNAQQSNGVNQLLNSLEP